MRAGSAQLLVAITVDDEGQRDDERPNELNWNSLFHLVCLAKFGLIVFTGYRVGELASEHNENQLAVPASEFSEPIYHAQLASVIQFSEAELSLEREIYAIAIGR